MIRKLSTFLFIASFLGIFGCNISGTITEEGWKALGGVTVTLSGDTSRTAKTNSNGDYTFPNLLPGNYTVTPSIADHTFSPPTQSLQLNMSDIFGISADFDSTYHENGPHEYEVKLTGTDSSEYVFFGNSVSISGEYAIVGAPGDGENGAAYIFLVQDDGSWILEKKLTASDGALDDEFGYSVAIDGEYAIVGAWRDDDESIELSENIGSAYIFYRNQGGTRKWGQQAKLTPSDGFTLDKFGNSVAISGDYAIVGSYMNDESAYIFKRKSWTWVEEAKLKGSDTVTSDMYGYSVSIDGETAVIGATGNDDMGSSSGSAYIFSRNEDGVWNQQQKLIASDGSQFDYFGYSVSISGDFIVVSAFLVDDYGDRSGAVYLFRYDGTNWIQEKKLTASDAAAIDLFGASVSISGDYIIVGTTGDDDNGNSSGSAYIFYRDQGGPDNWGEQKKLTASDGEMDDVFGHSVSISGEYAIVGAKWDGGYGNYFGSSYIYDWIPFLE